MDSITLDEEGKRPSGESWKSLPSTTAKCVAFATIPTEEGIIVAGGLNGRNILQIVERFNVSNETWTQLPSMSNPRYGCAGAVVGRKIFVFGGDRPTAKTAEFLDLDADTWHDLPRMPCPRAGAATVAVGRHVFLIGGKGQSSDGLRTVDCLDTVTHQWIQDALPSLNMARIYCAAAATTKGD